MFVASLRNPNFRSSSYCTSSLLAHLLPLRIHPSLLNHLDFSSSVSNEDLFIVSDLTDSPGFSSETERSGPETFSKCPIKGEVASKADSVISFFEGHGFSPAQIATMVRKYPDLLRCNAEKNLLPKMEFYYSQGLSRPVFAALASAQPFLFKGALEKSIKPAFNFIRDLVKSDEKMWKLIKRCSSVLSHYGNATRNVSSLRDSGVPESKIALVLLHFPRAIASTSPDIFNEKVQTIKEMKFDPSKCTFVLAVCAMVATSKSKWESRLKVYKSWGWSEEELLSAFRANPFCMTKSEDKVNSMMDFFINKMGWEPALIAKHPKLLMLSLEKRIIPRMLTVQFLISKGLVERHSCVYFLISAKAFMQKLCRYKEEAPQITEFYQEKLNNKKPTPS